ncbi:MAG TPA: efflux RND transporter periplasmic adaptor subunit [Parachlamydiaceae bacterium]|nr:efflux RND transporter periplasmic adaptor subunit [Parachlamydiaceae bacterium]
MIHSEYRFSKVTLFLVFLCLFSCGKDNPPANAKKIPVVVTTYQIKASDVPVSFDYVAQTQSSHLVNIQARVTGFLDKRVYTEGEFVKAGQVLFIMDKKPFETQVNAAKAAVARQEAALETARLNLARVKPLTALNALSQKDLDDATGTFETNAATLEQTKAQLETALLNLSYCTITSPIDGITSSALQQEGSYLSYTDSLLTTVMALSPIWVNFSLSENQIQNFEDQVRNGSLIVPKDNELDVKVIQMNGQVFPFTGKITFTEPYFNAQTGTFLIRASVDNPKGALRPNQYVRAKIEGSIRPNAILVPQRAVQQSAKGQFVWVVKNNTADFRPVIVGDWQGENWFITEGLKSGEEIVVDGIVGLHPGDELKIKDNL